MRSFARLLLLLAVVLVGPIGSAIAQTGSPAPVDVLLLIDDSGSMSDQWASGTREPNDPLGLRHSAARLFIDLAREGDRLGVISFHTDPTALGEAAEGSLTTISGPASKQALQSAIVQPTTPAPDERWTDMRKALRLASNLLGDNRTTNRQFIVFLTDGRPWPQDQRPELLQLIDELGEADVTIFPILLGADVDQEIAERMAERTGSQIQSIDSPDDLLEAYARIYGFVQPERYVDDVRLADGRVAAFRTSPDQGITNISVIVPRSPEGPDGFADLTLGGQSILSRPMLDNGATLQRHIDDHYEVVTVDHNAPLVGDWVASAGASGTPGTPALLIADSATSLMLQYPGTEDLASTAAPRYYPAGKPVLLAAVVNRSGARAAGLDVQAVLDGVQQPLSSEGLSDDGSVYWTVVSPDDGGLADQRTPVEVQVGDEVTPVRLLKEFTLLSGDFPQLVADSPTDRASGLLDDGRLQLQAHFEGDQPPESARIVAYISDASTGTVSTLEMPCDSDGVCVNRDFEPQEGRSYAVTFVANATDDGVPYTDFAQGNLAMRDVLRLDSLPPILDLGRLPPYENSISRDLVLTALTSLPVDLEAMLELTSTGGEVSADALALSLSQPTYKEGNRYQSLLQIDGFDALPPGEYSGRIRFQAPEGIEVEPSAVALQFAIPTPEVSLTLPSSSDLGDIARAGEPQQFNLQAEFSDGEVSDITAQILELTSGGRTVDSSDFEAWVGSAQPVQAGSRRYTLPLFLSATDQPKPGFYQATLLLSSPEGLAVEPQRLQVAFNVPQPVTFVTAAGDLVDFGQSADLSQPLGTDVRLQQTILDEPPPVRVSLVNLSHSELEPGAPVDLNVTAGAVQTLEDGSFQLPLYANSVGEPVPGIYRGVIRLETPADVSIQPAEVGFVVQQFTPLEAWQHRLQPAVGFVANWFIPLPFLRWQGLVGWLVLLILINTLLRLRPTRNQARGVIQAEETGATTSLRGHDTLYLVVNGSRIDLSDKKRDRTRALATVTFEQQVDSHSEQLVWRPVLRPNPLAPEPARLALWRTRSSRWTLIKEEGSALWNGARFRLRLPSSGARYHFRFALQ